MAVASTKQTESSFSPSNKTFHQYKLSDQDLPPSIPLVIPPGCEYDSRTYSIKKCAGDNSPKEFVLADKALEILKAVEKPVAVLAICGPYRSGKSFFLSRFLGIKEAFRLGHTTRACTRGIWLSTSGLICDEYVLLLLDSEGIDAVGEGETSDEVSMSILTLTNLLSSFLIYNSVNVPEKDDLMSLSYFGHLSAKLLKQDSSLQQDAMKMLHEHLPKFCWLLRDVELKLPSKYKTWTSYIKETVLQDSTSTEAIGSDLLALYPDLECIDLPHPGCGAEEMLEEENLEDEFIEKFKGLAMHILESMKVKKGYSLKPMNGLSLACLARQYVSVINTPGTVPNLKQCWNDSNILESVECLLQAYRLEMNKILSEKFPVEFDNPSNNTSSRPSLMEVHNQILQAKLAQLKSKARELLSLTGQELVQHSFYKKAEDTLCKRIATFNEKKEVSGGILLEFAHKNERASRDHCYHLFMSLCPTYRPLRIDDIKTEYFHQAVGPKKDEVFDESFLSIPEPLKNIRIVKLTSDRAEICWDYSRPNPVSELEYQVHIERTNSEDKPAPEEIKNSFIVLNNLKPGTEYRVEVYGIIQRLQGEGVEITFTTKPAPPNKPEIIKTYPLLDTLSEIKIEYKQPTTADENGSTITKVIARYHEITAKNDSEQLLREIPIEDLPDNCLQLELENITSPEMLYSIQLSFENAIGEGPSAETVFDTMRMIPGPPKNFRVVGRGHERIKLRWGPPSINPGTVDHYIIHMRKMDQEPQMIYNRKPTRSLSAVAKLLDSDSKYNFVLTAVNKKGKGVPTEEFPEWIETRYSPSIRAALIAGAAVGGTAATPVLAAVGATYASGELLKKGIEKKSGKQIAGGIAGLLSAPLTAPAGALAGAVGAPVGGGVLAKKAYDKLDSDSDLADSEDERDRAYRKRAEKSEMKKLSLGH